MRGYKNFESNPHPGNLNQRIEIGYTDNKINENGFQTKRDVIVCKTWAIATDAGNQHYRDSDQINTDQVINFTIRYRRDVKAGMWVLFNGIKYMIETLGEYGFKRTYLGLKATHTEGIG